VDLKPSQAIALALQAENLSEGCGFDDVTDLLYVPWGRLYGKKSSQQVVGFETMWMYITGSTLVRYEL